MIHGHLQSRDAYAFLLAQPAWQTAFAWLETLSPATPAGRVDLRGDELYANVHGYEPLPAAECPFESHHRYVDLQYCIAGGEVMEWAPATTLQVSTPYHEANDIIFYHRPAHATTRLQMVPGAFAIFYPSDAHAPKVADGQNHAVFKVVIKLKLGLVA